MTGVIVVIILKICKKNSETVVMINKFLILFFLISMKLSIFIREKRIRMK